MSEENKTYLKIVNPYYHSTKFCLCFILTTVRKTIPNKENVNDEGRRKTKKIEGVS
jgi:hypothetical protein